MSTVLRLNWYLRGFIHKHGKILLASIGGGIVLVLFLPNLFSVLPAVKKTTYVGRVGRFTLSGMPRDIQEKVSVGLTKINQNGEAIPAVASSYRAEEDGKTYRFTIRPNLLWQDGTTLTPKDINYMFSDTEVSRSQNDILYRITAQKQSETAQEPVLPVSFLSTVSQPLFKQMQIRRYFFLPASKIVGLGEYSIESLQYNGNTISQIVLESLKDRLIYRFYPTEHEAIIAFKHGKVDRLESMQSFEDISEWENVLTEREIHRDQYVGLFFNLAYQHGDNQPYSSRTFRLALNYAIQKTQGDERVVSPIQNTSWAYIPSDDDIDRFEQDMTEAVDNLMKTETTEPLTIELTTIPSYTVLAEQIKTNWEELGTRTVEKCSGDSSIPENICQNKKIQVSIHIVNVPDLSSYQVMLIGQQMPPDPDQYSLWHSTQSTNFTHFKNARVDKILEDARRNPNKEERKLLYQEFQRLLVKESPAIFLQPISTYTITRKHNWL